jgi:hypothetical protein
VGVFLVQLAATLAMTGVIWVVQLVHYPLFARVGADVFADYHADHTRLITLVVVPLMLVEAGTALWIVVDPPLFVPARLAWLGLALVGVVWGSTFFGQVPLHGVLSRGFDPAAHATLVGSNWIRTVAWTARSALVLLVLTRSFARSAAM